MDEDLKERLRKWFKWNKETYTELDDYEIEELFSSEIKKSFGEFLLSNGFTSVEIFSQVRYYYNHIYDCVLTAEYSDNTGKEYWRYFDSAEEYNKHVSINPQGMR